MKLLYSNIQLNKSKNTLIQDERKLFSYIDSDFEYLMLNDTYTAPKIKAEVYEMEKDGTFKDIFTSLDSNIDNLVMTQGQIIDFCKNHGDKLLDTGYGNLFLLKSRKDYFVADVSVDGGGSLEVGVDRFGFASVCYASLRHRVVVPQLKTKKLKTDSLTLKTLEKRLEKIEDILEKIRGFLVL